MKKHLILAGLMLFSMTSCLDDESAYEPQLKENVTVDKTEGNQGGEEQEYPEGALVPGIHQVTIDVTLPDGSVEERRFKYFMPISIDESQPISLIFEFHGSYSFDAGVTPPNPIEGITQAHTLNQHAIQENCIICFPAGSVEMQEDTSGAVNWQNSERHLPFVDAMVEYFKERSPRIDTDRIYSTGQSSGAIFSFVLAFERSDVFAAITPRAGQMSLANQTQMPTRAVPIRVFAGIDDDIVIHSAVISNMTSWAEKIGGYFASDMVLTNDSIEIENYRKVDTRIWSGGKTDLQIYSLQEEGHSIAIGYVLPYMWEFMENHPKNAQTNNLFVNCSMNEIEAQCGQTFSLNVNYTEDASFSIETPKGWTMVQSDKEITLKAPSDFFGAVGRNGNIILSVTKNGAIISKKIPYKLLAPKNYFEVGDIYYNEAFKPIGVVCWVNENNIKEATIINLEEVTTQGTYQTIHFGNFGADFNTPDYENGEANTAAHITQNSNLSQPMNNVTSGLIWAAEYRYEDVDGWYLPAINEIKAINDNLSLIEDVIVSIGGEALVHTATYDAYLSSTVTLNEGAKCFHMFNFTTGAEQTYSGVDTAYYRARAFKKVYK